MEVSLELKPIQWSCSQGSLYCEGEWILVYSVTDNYNKIDAQCHLVDCPKLMEKYKLVSDVRGGFGNFESIEEAQQVCEAHFRELMLKAFLQPV